MRSNGVNAAKRLVQQQQQPIQLRLPTAKAVQRPMQVVTVNPLPNVDAGADVEICYGLHNIDSDR